MRGLLRRLKLAILRASGTRGERRSDRRGQVPAESRTGAGASEWEYVPDGWARPPMDGDVDAIARSDRGKWGDYLAAIAAPNPLGVQHDPAGVTTGDVSAHNALAAFAYVVSLAARGRGRLSVLDWGGGIGHHWALARSVVPGLELEYHVKEAPAVCAQGREVAPDVSFHEDETCLERGYDLVVASSSLKYAENWSLLLDRLAGAAQSHLYLEGVPVALSAPSFVVLRRAYAHGDGTGRLGWVLNRHEFLAYAAGSGVSLAREFLLDTRFLADGAPETPVEHRSFLFNR